LFLQWVQAYEVDSPTIRTVYATLRDVFPHVHTWLLHRDADIALVASTEPIVYDIGRIRARLETEPYKSGLLQAWGAREVEDVLSWFVGGSELATAVARAEKGRINTDDLNLVEFGFARAMGRATSVARNSLREAALVVGAERPPTTGGTLNWSRVVDAIVPSAPTHASFPAWYRTLEPEQQQLGGAFEAFQAGSYAAALARWDRLGREPRTLDEIRLVTQSAAETGDARALQFLAELHPVDADLFRAVLADRQGRPVEAMALVVSSLERYHHDPTPRLTLVDRALTLAASLVDKQPELAADLLPVLRTPFVVAALNERRLTLLSVVAAALPTAAWCPDLVEPMGSVLPWDEAWLVARFRCWSDRSDPRLPLAVEELKRFRSEEPLPLMQGLGSVATTPPPAAPGS
jgi:hypothetical protein